MHFFAHRLILFLALQVILNLIFEYRGIVCFSFASFQESNQI
ncbi:hypothetical protein EV07_0508 [Prochlorococcus sp. MIT 0603]|nr:hypothetical protein EV07_0508 [Prochlorococcus sp. MIT 0603]